MNRFVIILLFTLVFALNAADEIAPDSPEAVYHFADYLFQYGEYRRAATEYLRYYSLYSHKDDSEYALFNAAFSLEKSSEYCNARKFYRILENKSENTYARGISSYRIALSFYLNDEIDSCLLYINDNRNSQNFSLRYLEGFCYLQMREYAQAESLFSTLSTMDAGRELSSSVHYLISKSRQGNSLPARSPFTAGMLSSFVPGLGMGYSGKWGDALFSFLAVAVTITPAVYYYEEDQAFAITTGVIGLFFYGGNIFGSVNAAKRFNEDEHRHFYQQAIDGVPYEPNEINTRLKE